MATVKYTPKPTVRQETRGATPGTHRINVDASTAKEAIELALVNFKTTEKSPTGGLKSLAEAKPDTKWYLKHKELRLKSNAEIDSNGVYELCAG